MKMKWQVETITSYGWDNLWREDSDKDADDPTTVRTTYRTREEARAALREHIKELKAAGMYQGPGEFRVSKTNQ